MNWTRKTPDKPGYYFLDNGEEERMVEVFVTSYGASFKDFWSLDANDCSSIGMMYGAQWLGPINSEDIINLWMEFEKD